MQLTVARCVLAIRAVTIADSGGAGTGKQGGLKNPRPSGVVGLNPTRRIIPPMDSAGRMEIVRELCSFERRLTDTDAERRAANRLAERLRELGRTPEVEPIHVH